MYKLNFHDFREVNVSIKSVDSISVFWRPRGRPPRSLPLKSSPGFHSSTIFTDVCFSILNYVHHFTSSRRRRCIRMCVVVIYTNPQPIFWELTFASSASPEYNCPHFVWNILQILGFEVLTAVVMKTTIFWDITMCSPLSVNGRFRGTRRYIPEDGTHLTDRPCLYFKLYCRHYSSLQNVLKNRTFVLHSPMNYFI
jgi:hypothetical protein